MNTFKQNIEEGNIVKFQAPLPDEEPDQVYIVLEVLTGKREARAKIRALGTGLKFPPSSTVSVSDLAPVKIDTSDIIGNNVIIETVKGDRVDGKVIKVWNEHIKAELTRIKDGVDTNVYVTVEDDSGRQFDGFLFVKP